MIFIISNTDAGIQVSYELQPIETMSKTNTLERIVAETSS